MSDERANLPSASGYERIVACPGSFELEKKFPETGKADPQADRGTRIHKAFETGDDSELSDDERDDYRQGVKHLDLLVAQWQRDYSLARVEELPRESRLWLHHPNTFDPLGSGRMDRWFRSVSGDHALIVDLKSGWATHVPPSPRNPQMRFYALCVWKELGVSHVRVAIDRAKSFAGAEDYCDFTLADLEYSEQLLLQHLWWAAQPDAPRYPGPHCHFCKAKSGCLEAASMSLLPGVIAQRAAPDRKKVEDQVGMLADADLLKIWNADTIIRRVLDAVDARLKTFPKERLAELGLELPAEGRKLDPITNVKGAFEFLRDIQQLPEEELWKAMAMNKGPIEKLIREAKNLTEKGSKGWVSEAMSEYITKKNAEPSLRKLKE